MGLGGGEIGRWFAPPKPTHCGAWVSLQSNIARKAVSHTITNGYDCFMGAWRGWYHVNGNTYGTWLPGDERGWRARDHREHVEGDYRSPPPPGVYDGLRAKAEGQMKGGAVFLGPDVRRIAGQAMVEMLLHQGVELLAFSLDAIHYHLLARFGELRIRSTVGRAKKHSYHILRERGHEGRVWALRCRSLPIRDRQHQVNVYRYIRAHASKGAWVWTYKQGVCWAPTLKWRE